MPVYVVKKKHFSELEGVPARQCYRWHCETKAAERLGITYSKRLKKEILKNITEGRGIFVRKTSNSRTVWKNVVPGYPEVYVVYSKSTKEIITMYSPKAVSNP